VTDGVKAVTYKIGITASFEKNTDGRDEDCEEDLLPNYSFRKKEKKGTTNLAEV